MLAPRTALAVALAAGAAACDAGSTAPGPMVWIGQRDEARVLAVPAQGGQPADAAAAPAIDGPVRALLRRSDGNVVALQDVSGGAPPAVLLSPSGQRLAELASASADGKLQLFVTPDRLPWAVAEASDGSVWITGSGPPGYYAPVRYTRDGALVGWAEPLSFPMRGITALPDGRIAVACDPDGIALYGADGKFAGLVSSAIGPAYYGLDALVARPDGTLLVSVLRHDVALLEGVVIAARIDAGSRSLVAVSDPEASARFEWMPSAIAVVGEDVVVGPFLGPLAPPACAERLSGDLTTRGGCLVPGAQRGVAVAP